MLRRTGLLAGLFALFSGACGDSGGNGGGTPLDTIRFEDRVDFRRVPIGLSVTEPISFVQEASGIVQLLEVREGEGFSTGEYAFEVETSLPLEIGSGGPVNLTFSFEAPTDVGQVQASATLVFSGNETREITLVATTDEAIEVTLPDNTLDLGRVVSGRVVTRNITIRNRLERPIPVYVEAENGRPNPMNAGNGIGEFEIDAAVDADDTLASSPLFPGDELDIPVQYTPPNERGMRDIWVWRIGACPSLDNVCGIDITLTAQPLTAPIECRIPGESGLVEEIDFGKLNPPEVATATVTCEVTGAARLDSFSTPGFDTGVRVEENLAEVPPSDLDVGTEFQVFFRFDPSRIDAGDDIPDDTVFEINVTDPDTGADLPNSVIALKGGFGRPIITLEPETLDFQSAALTTLRPDRFTVTNTGPVPFMGRMRIENAPGTEDAAFTSPTDGTQFNVEPGATRTIDVTFNSQPPAGNKAATVFIETTEFTDPRNPNVQETLEIVGVAESLPPCNVAVTPSDEVDFGASPARTENRAFVVVKNDNSSRCLVNGIRLAPGSDPAFRLIDPPSEVRLSNDESYVIELAFLPDRAADAPSFDYSGRLEFYVSSADGNYDIPITGQQTSVALLRAPNVGDFVGGTNDCTEYTQEIALVNGAADALSVQSITLDAPVGSPFTLRFGDDVPPYSINRRGGRRTFEVVGRPPATGNDHRNARVLVQVSNQPEPHVIPLLLQVDSSQAVVERFVQAGTSEAEVVFVLPFHADGTDQSLFDLMSRPASLWDEFIAPVVAAGQRYEVGFVRGNLDPNVCGAGIAPEPEDPGALHRGGCGWLANGDIPPGSGLFTQLWKLIDGNEGMLTEDVAFSGHMNKGVSTFFPTDEALEAGLLALHPTLTTGWNSDLLSDDAHLHMVFINNVDDGSDRSVEAYADWLRYVRGHPRRFDVTTSVVVGPEAGGCETGEYGPALPAARFTRLNRLVGGGLEISVCNSNWQQTMTDVGTAAAGIRQRVRLDRNADAATIQVFADGAEIPDAVGDETNWTYDDVDRVLTFTSTLTAATQPGAEVEIRYDPLCNEL